MLETIMKLEIILNIILFGASWESDNTEEGVVTFFRLMIKNHLTAWECW